MRSLSWKLGGALLLIVVVSVGLMAYLANLSTAREFQQYIMRGSMVYTQHVADILSQHYTKEQGWSGLQDVLAGLLRSRNDRLIVADSSGAIVGDTEKNLLGKDTTEAGLGDGSVINASGEYVGNLYLLVSAETRTGMGHMGGRGSSASPMLSLAEEDFLDRINSSLWVAGLAAIAVALVLGLILTRQITRPVHALTRGARHIASGNLGYRVNVGTKDELGEMAQSFNSMASTLERSEQSRQRLLADITHELRTPLTVIEGTIDGMLDNVFEPDREHLGSIKEQTTLLTRLIGDLRELSLAESGQLRLNLALTDIVALVRRKISQAEVGAKEKSIRLSLNVPRNVPEIKVDSTRIEQVIANLLTNAIRHTPAKGSVTVSIKTEASDDAPHLNRPGVIISVADTGGGIAAENLPHVFERFYRASDSRSRSEGGPGLGLSIVKQMVQAHGGEVWVESESSKGSIFYIALPLSSA